MSKWIYDGNHNKLILGHIYGKNHASHEFLRNVSLFCLFSFNEQGSDEKGNNKLVGKIPTNMGDTPLIPPFDDVSTKATVLI